MHALSKDEEKGEIRERRERKKIEIKWNLDKVLGLVITIIGLFMLLYSFFLANNFVIGSFTIDEAFLIRFIFLICMSLIGGYLIDKGATLIENTKIIGLILLSLGLILLIFVFLIASIFVIGRYVPDLSYIVKLMFFFYMVGIGIFLTRRGYEFRRSVSV